MTRQNKYSATQSYSAFSYKPGKSFFHRLPSWVKICFIPLFNIAVFSLNWRFAALSAVLQCLLFFCLHFSVREQLADLTPVLWYAVFLYLINLFSETFLDFGELGLLKSIAEAVKNCLHDEKTFSTVIKFFACNQSASLMFKTSTSLELREGIEKIEISVRRFLPVKKEPAFAMVVSMFINFIPAVFKMWGQLKRAWFARGGKFSIKMYLALFPVLFTLGLKYSLDSAKAVLVRTS